MTASSTDSAIDTRLDDLLAEARGIENALAAGHEQDATELETGIQNICTDIAALPRESARTYLPRLQDLTDALDRISGTMRGRLDGLSAELKQHGARKTAVRAYGKAGSTSSTPTGRR
ncbi:hypothetical protein [Rhodovibrio salinarum]|uniref:Flagellar protein FliT n=1 Tax=Rhodovibrio salinarum TaxID=1087 RepID=A0A934QK70_9PROT|nr:hypothetical protein [Rhodovibrio salinarum]MBK1698407.1 hypothetical protein [Rhodovibrio salinarum]